MLIGLHGKKQAGKDTVYERLTTKLADATVERVSFADKLYESAAAALGISVEYLRELKTDPEAFVLVRASTEEPHPPTRIVAQQSVREYLQHYGTEAHRDVFGSDFWVERADFRDHSGKVVVVTDVRFRNEAQAVIDAGGAVVHVIGPPDVEGAGDGHASEETLPARFVDVTIYNDVRDDGFACLDRLVVDLFLRLRREGF